MVVMFFTRGPLPLLSLWERFFREALLYLFPCTSKVQDKGIGRLSLPWNPKQALLSFPVMNVAATSTKCFPRFSSINGGKVLNGLQSEGDLAIHIVSGTKYHAVFKKHCFEQLFCIPEEQYIPTYVNMFHGSLIENRTHFD
ncbi:hypothetical protein SADUNF_Sadunf03G0002000 [Salix dunnii]|uniref:Uncharacterized protein n=1 Tax=Salix dunnii TaxID=1413687 RepID=A0A835N1C4_9ROSI|nr:hypothetical protein SADUNF_Sadunf03G0002000 [Salix dunnii]